jgi:beta-phosphoglucomutase-like phosphatase (HAD superfamily)
VSRQIRLDGIVLDCDGVLIESVDIKTQVYRGLFEGFPEHQDAIVSYHLANGGLSRVEKIKHIYKEILKRPLSEGQLALLCERFAALSLAPVLAAPLVNGTREFVEACRGRVRLFVASGTPQQELERVLSHKGLGNCFTAVFGSPLSKVEILRRILSEWGLAPEAMLAVGDAPTDWQAAAAHGIRFVARVRDGEPAAFLDEVPRERVRDLEELRLLVDGLVGAR